jgi:hypothetical protein
MRSRKHQDELQTVPGIGPSLAADLHLLGYARVADLKNENPQKMYDRLCKKTGFRHDPCVLYTFRCAVYFATVKKHDPELLKWWNWKGRTI